METDDVLTDQMEICRPELIEFFIMVPIMAPPVNSRPSAAVATGLVLWACLAVSTTSLVVAANALIWLFAAVALTI